HTLDWAARHGKLLFLGFGEAGVLVMHFGPSGSLELAAGDAALLQQEPTLSLARGKSAEVLVFDLSPH
ncbi:MAG: hypothetical protein M3150_04310, partial [Pseudomonadota bacterium]|nr:hypothetical protein [Pseudomonadota bacterium]